MKTRKQEIITELNQRKAAGTYDYPFSVEVAASIMEADESWDSAESETYDEFMAREEAEYAEWLESRKAKF